ncbi:MAG: S9 family peptidase [Proteobacteria bacterium]|nr:S9 family peptidase [Pseudomonadota bacterium]
MAALCLVVAGCGRPDARAPVASAPEAALIARETLFGDAPRSGARLSPRGDKVAFLAPRDGASNIWLMSVGAMDEARPVTDETDRGIRSFVWAQDNATLLYLQDAQGDGNTRLYAVNAAGGVPRALTPAAARAQILGVAASDPTGVVVSLNQRDAAWPDVFRIDLGSSARTLLERNPGGARGIARYYLDHDGRVRLGLHPTPDGGAEMMARGVDGRWARLFAVAPEDALSATPLGFAADGRSFLMLDSTGDRSALTRVDAATGAKTVIGESARADVSDVWIDPATNTPHAFAAEYLRPEWRALDPDAQADVDFLDHQLTGDFRVTSRSNDDARWIVVEEGPTTPARTYLYDRTDRAHRRLSLLFRNRPALEQAPLQAMTPVEINARDGLTLVSYLTLPPGSDLNGDGRPDQPEPLVVIPHDGPWSRDSYGFNALHQWLANRGYAVLSVNFRGSTGFGKAFLNAGNREWGGRMQDDLLDAVQWAIRSRIAQPDRIAIAGAGFGGYAALLGLATTQQFRCGVSFGGPVNLASMLDSLSVSLPAMRDQLYFRVGDPRTAEGRQMLRDRSPLWHAGQIRNPLLLALGLHDAHAPRGEADQIAFALRARGAGITYVVFPDEGRELTRTHDRLSFLAIVEHFLGDCLGGRVEPVGEAFEGASLIAYDGAYNVPGLSAFARRLSAPAAAPDQTPDEAAIETTTEPSSPAPSPPDTEPAGAPPTTP